MDRSLIMYSAVSLNNLFTCQVDRHCKYLQDERIKNLYEYVLLLIATVCNGLILLCFC